MYRVFSCLATEHNYWLVALAAFVCISTALSSFWIYAQACESRGPRRIGWACITGVCAGSGVWATHFVAMLAYDGGFPTAYEPIFTLASLVVAIVIAAAGFLVAIGQFPLNRILGGAIIGAGIGAMHFTGMKALLVPGAITWQMPLVFCAWILALPLASAATFAFHRKNGPFGIAVGAGLFTLAVCSLHFVAMGAVIINPDPTVIFQPSGINRSFMAMLVTGVVFIVLLSALAGAAIQNANTRCEALLRNQNERLEAALRYLPIGMSMFDSQQRLLLCNPAYREIFGLSEAETPNGKSFSELVLKGGVQQDVLSERSNLDQARHRLSQHSDKLAKGEQFTHMQHLADGRTIFVRIVPIAGGGWVDINEDITQRLHHEADIAHMARHDALTGLPNRLHLRESLDTILKDASKSDEQVAVHFLDLDKFKEVNDTLGHSVGDDLLKAVSERLRHCVREADLVARIGGDEFVIVQTSQDPLGQAEALARRLIEKISAPYSLSGHEVTIGTSIGIALVSDGTTSETVIQHADLALYCAKDSGRGTFRIFEQEMLTSVHARRELESDLRSALANGELSLNYQPASGS